MNDDINPRSNNEAAEEEDWKYSKQISRFGETQIVVGVTRNPRNLMWQTWVSLYGNDVTCLTAHRSRQIAEQTIARYAAEYEAGKLVTPEQVSRYVEKMPTDKMPSALPQFTLREIEHQINSLFFGLCQ